MERTLAIVKPDAVAKGVTGQILARIEKEGFRIVALRMVRLAAPRPRGSTPSTASGPSSAISRHSCLPARPW